MYSRLWSTASCWTADRGFLVLLLWVTHRADHLLAVPLDGKLLNVKVGLPVQIAVAGTLLGTTVTYIFQRANAGRAERFARDERLRQERIAAHRGFARAVAEVRRGVISLWFGLQRSTLGDPERNAAYTESDLLGAVAHHAQGTVRERRAGHLLAQHVGHLAGPVRPWPLDGGEGIGRDECHLLNLTC